LVKEQSDWRQGLSGNWWRLSWVCGILCPMNPTKWIPAIVIFLALATAEGIIYKVVIYDNLLTLIPAFPRYILAVGIAALLLYLNALLFSKLASSLFED
jgi:hypothetical protein